MRGVLRHGLDYLQEGLAGSTTNLPTIIPPGFCQEREDLRDGLRCGLDYLSEGPAGSKTNLFI